MLVEHLSRPHFFVIFSLLAAPVMADSQGLQSQEHKEVLLPLLVTATKIEKDPIDIPFGLSVMNAEALDRKRIDSVKRMLENTANVDIVTSADGRPHAIKIRGVGPLIGPANAEDTSVVVYVDGIPQPLSSIANGYFDIERVEVLKGPQGTLFGRNTTGGAINIITPTPSDEPELFIRTEVGENNHYLLDAVASGVVVEDKVYGRFSFTTKGDGAYVKNDVGPDIGEVNKNAARGALFFIPDDYTDVKLTLSAEQDIRNFSVIGLMPEEGDDFKVSLDEENKVKKDAYGLGLTVNHDMGDFTFTSATGLNDVKSHLYTDDTDGLFYSANFGVPSNTYNNPDIDYSDWHERHKTLSQEFRLSSTENSEMSWVSGASFYHSDYNYYYVNHSQNNALTNNGTRDGDQSTQSYSLFGEGTIAVGGGFNIAAGLRYTHEKKDEDFKYTGNGLGGTVASAQRKQALTDNFVTGRTSVIYELNPTSRLFATLSSGHKTGGFQRFSTNIATVGAADDSYGGSDITAYEIGFKHRSASGDFSFDTSLFYNTLDNEQVSQFDPVAGGFKTLNVDALTYGLELQGTYRINNAWDISGNLSRTFSEMRHVDAEFASLVKGENGNALPNTPEWTGGVSIDYRDQVSWVAPGSEVFTNLSWQHTGAREGNVGNSFKLKAFDDVNLRTGVALSHDLEFYGFVNNLLDENKEQFGFDFFGQGNNLGVSVGRDRVIGLGMKAGF